jgi:hypothetical protein
MLPHKRIAPGKPAAAFDGLGKVNGYLVCWCLRLLLSGKRGLVTVARNGWGRRRRLDWKKRLSL